MANPAEYEELAERVVNALLEAARTGVTQAAPEARPSPLFHFTDTNGLVGILTDRVLWASFASAMNDTSEGRYGLTLARELLQDEPADVDTEFRNGVIRFLSGEEARAWGVEIDWRVFVVSFCATADRAVNWLHYGHAGTGYALGFAPETIEQSRFRLCRVLYKRDEQAAAISRLIRAMFASFQELSVSLKPYERVILELAQHVTATYLKVLAAQLKDPAFEDEREWRLIGYDVANGQRLLAEPTGTGLPTLFRLRGERIVPYKKLALAPFGLQWIIAGASASIKSDDRSLALLLTDSELPDVRVEPSAIPLRP